MSKNIFNVLATHDDSDDERRPTNKAQPAKPTNAPKDTKKEARAKDTQLREKYGDRVDKDTRPPNRGDGPKTKDNYAPGEKRPYERHSGTGKPAFKKNDFKKEGHGKGNVGTNPDQANNEGENANNEDNGDANVNIVKLPEEEIVTLDDYINNTGATFGIKGGDQQVKKKDPKAFEDANTKAIVSKRTQQQDDEKKNVKQVEKKQTNKNVVEIEVDASNQKRRDNRQGGNKQGYVKYDKNEFPSLD